MSEVFLGKPNEKIREYIESKNETREGKWTLCKDGEQILVLTQYTENLPEKKWCKEDDANTFIAFGSERGAIIPHWMFYSGLSITLNAEDPYNTNLKTIKASKSGETSEYVFKWSKT